MKLCRVILCALVLPLALGLLLPVSSFAQTGLPSHINTLTLAVSGEGEVSPGAGVYLYTRNSEVTVKANPAPGWRFVNWTGSVADPFSEYTKVTLTSDKVVTANFVSETRSLILDLMGEGSTSPAGNHDYPDGTVLPIKATPAPGWQFVNWIGNVGDRRSPETTVTVDFPKKVTALFSRLSPVLSISVSGEGTTDPVPGDHTYTSGTVVEVQAIPGEGWKFAGWSGNVTNSQSPETTIHVNSDANLTANFAKIVRTLTSNVEGQGSISPSGITSYDQGSVVNVTATPSSGWKFDGWSGPVASPDSPTTTVKMDSDIEVTAKFSPITHSLTLGKNGEGSITPSAGEYAHPEGAVVTIKAVPAANWKFDGWDGQVADPNSATTTVKLDTDKTITANFSPVPVQAGFTADRTSVEYPDLTVRFTDQSTGYVTSWRWDFGDGTVSNEQNPVHEYKTDGSYTVKLTVSGPAGSDVETRDGYIDVTGCPT